MHTVNITELEAVRLSGRYDRTQAEFSMLWSGASAHLRVKGSQLDVRIACTYESLKPYISFEVDGLRAQLFAPIQGTHWYNVFLSADAGKVHDVRITLETQAFSADPSSHVAISQLRTDGAFHRVPEPELKLEFIGDSITSGEGLRGPHDFMEWLPMCFCASDTYASMIARELNAQVQFVSQSGWGIVSAWDNNPANNLPDAYDFICLPPVMQGIDRQNCGSGKAYDFSFEPDFVVVNLGTNDSGALCAAPFVDEKTGARFALSEMGLPYIEEKAYAFILHLQEKNPKSKIIWAYGVLGNDLLQPLTQAVDRAKAQGVDVHYVQLTDMGNIPGGVGSREHPGVNAHEQMARTLIEAINSLR